MARPAVKVQVNEIESTGFKVVDENNEKGRIIYKLVRYPLCIN